MIGGYDLGNTQDFFYEKKDWSRTKDDLLGYYLKLYFQKLLAIGKNIKYIDCFAGKGKFGDGEKGSPLIAMEIGNDALENRRKWGSNGIEYIFIEKKFSDELKANVIGNNVQIYDCAYQECFEKITQKFSNDNVFVYIDPFGIKDIHFKMYECLRNSCTFSHEILLNLNAFGFFREGCRLMKVEKFDKDINVLGAEYFDDNKNSIANMDKIANGDYWQSIINDYQQNVIDAHEAEEAFVKEYCIQLKNVFSFVLEIPIKLKVKNIAKYRMIYATNHCHGYIEMADNMHKRWKNIQIISEDGQQSLFDFDYNNNVLDMNIEDKILANLADFDEQYSDFLCRFIDQHGIYYSLSDIRQAMKSLEKKEKVNVKRVPGYTKTGRKAKWFDYSRNISVSIK